MGTVCDRGSTLEALPLLKGYFRLDSTSIDVRVCPDARKNCSTTFGTTECVSTSGCQGGTGALCATGLEGTYCELCHYTGVAVPIYYKRATDDSVAECIDCGNTLAQTFVYAAAASAMLASILALVAYFARRMSAATASELKRIDSTYTPQNKIKVLLTFYQLTTKVPRVYEVSLPSQVNAFLESLTGIISFGVGGIATTPLECLGLAGYMPRLVFWMVLPPVLVLVVVAVVAVSTSRKRRKRALTKESATKKEEISHGGGFSLHHLPDGEEREASIFEQTLPVVLKLLFILYPLVCIPLTTVRVSCPASAEHIICALPGDQRRI